MSITSPSISDPMQSPKATTLNKPELMELLIQGITGTADQTFQQKLERVFRRMPKIRSTIASEYLSHFFRGAVLTLPKTNLMQQLKIRKIYLEKISPNVLSRQKATRVAFQIENGQRQTLKLYLFAKAKNLVPTQYIHRQSLQQLIKASGFVGREIYGEIIHVNDKYKVNISPMKIYDQGELKEIDEILRELQSDSSSVSEDESWEEIVQSDPSQSFESNFLDLSSSETSDVKEAVNQILQKMKNTYQAYPKYLLTSEAAYHGFLHGSLEMNFLYRYALTIRVEPILGTGESRGDLLFLSRLEPSFGEFTGGKSWDNVASLIEIKARGIPAKKAFDQMAEYVLNDFGLRTIRDEICLAFWNPGLLGNEASEVQINKIQFMKKDFIQEIFNLPSENFIEAKIKLIKALKDIIKDFVFLGQIIAGQLTVPFSMSSYNLYHDQTLASKLTTFIMRVNNILVGLHIKKDSEITIPSINAEINHIKQELPLVNYVEIQIDINNLSDSERAITIKPIPLDSSSALSKEQKERLVEIKQFSFLDAQGAIDKEGLKNSLWSLKSLINSEKDFQMVLKGLLMRSPQCTSLFVESNYDGLGRADLVAVFDHKIKLLELKYAKGEKDAKRKQQQAEEQIEEYINNFKVHTDKIKAQSAAMTFNKIGSSSEILLFKEHEFTIDRTSGEESDEKSHYRNRMHPSLNELLRRKQSRKKRLEEELKNLNENPSGEYTSLKIRSLEGQLKICDLEIEILQIDIEIEGLHTIIANLQKISQEKEKKNEIVKENFKDTKEAVDTLEESIKPNQEALRLIEEAEEKIEEANREWEIADREEKEIRQKEEEALKEKVKNDLAKVAEKVNAKQREIDDLDDMEELAGYKAKEELSETLKKTQKNLEDLQAEGSPDLGILIGAVVSGVVFGGGAVLGGIAGKVTAGKVTAGKETAGKETAGKETAGKETAGKETAGKAAEKKAEKTDTSKQRPKIRTKKTKKRELCAATRRRRDLKTENSQIHMDKSLFIDQENFSRIRKNLRSFLGPGVDIRTLDLSWYMQLIGDGPYKEGENIFEIEGILGLSFLLGKESSYFTMLDKMTHVLSRDLDAFPLSVYELDNFCKCQREISRKAPNRVAFSDSEPKLITTNKDLEDALADTTSSWSKRLCIGEEEIFIRFSDGFYSYLDPKNVYVNQIPNDTRLRDVIYAQHKFSVSFWSDPKGLENKKNVTLQNIDIAKTAQAFSHITDQLPVLETEREQLQNQDKQKGEFNIFGEKLSRTMLYDLGLQIDDKDYPSSKAFDRTVGTELTVEKLAELFLQRKLSISVRNYMDVLDQIDVFSQDELKALILLSLLSFRKTEHRWEMERMTSLKALIHQVSTREIPLLRCQLQLIRGTKSPRPLSSTLSFTTLASVNFTHKQTIVKNYTTDSLGLISLLMLQIRTKVELGIDKNDLYFSTKDLSQNEQQFLVLKDYNKETSVRKVVIKDAEDQLWWPLIEKRGTNQLAQLIPFRIIHPIGSNICLFSEQLQEEPRIAIETGSQLIALQKGSDLLLIENKRKTLNQSKGLILKYFFREPKKWENLQIHIISTHERLTFRDINEQAKLAIELPLEYRSLLEENFVIEQPQIHNVSGLAGANLPSPIDVGILPSQCKPVYLDLTLNKYLPKIQVFKSNSTSDSKDEILGLRFVSNETTPSASTNDMSFPCLSVLKYQDLEISNLDAFNATEIDSLQSKIDKAFLFKQSQLEWGQMLADSQSSPTLMSLMFFLIIKAFIKNDNKDFNLLSAYLGFSTTADTLNFLWRYLDEYQHDSFFFSENVLFKGSVWLITRALLHEQNVFGNLHTCFGSLLPRNLITEIKEKVLNMLNMEKYSDLCSSMEEFMELHKKEKNFISRIKDHISNSFFELDQGLTRLLDKHNRGTIEAERLLRLIEAKRLDGMTREVGRLHRVTREVDNSAILALLKSDPLPIVDKHNRGLIDADDRRLQRVTREVDVNIHAISGGLRLFAYFFGRFKFIKRMQEAEQALLKSNLEPQEFIVEQNQADVQAIIDKLENKPRSYGSYIKEFFNKLG